MTDIYISADIEADGPIPGQYSMLAFGLAVAGTFDGTTFEPRETGSATFYRELRPISDQFDPAALGVARLDREVLARNGVEPAAAMRDAAEWVASQAQDTRPMFGGYSVVFDWMFMHSTPRAKDSGVVIFMNATRLLIRRVLTSSLACY